MRGIRQVKRVLLANYIEEAQRKLHEESRSCREVYAWPESDSVKYTLPDAADLEQFDPYPGFAVTSLWLAMQVC